MGLTAFKQLHCSAQLPHDDPTSMPHSGSAFGDGVGAVSLVVQ